MGELGANYRFESRTRDQAMVTSGRIHAARDGSPEFGRYPIEVTRAGRAGSKKGGAGGKRWAGLSDPEMRRKKRIVKYKVYSVEGKVKASLRKGFRWIKNKVSGLVHGY